MQSAKRTGVVPAGEFSRWLERYARGQNSDVPCGDCNACCRAAYFVEIRSEERETLALIPAARLTRTKRDPQWTLDQACAGHCPMLVDGACSIYAQRPQACRRFDCRVFAAAGVPAGSGPRAAVNKRAWQWRFAYPSELDAACQSAVLCAAAFLQSCADLIDPEVAPADAGELARAAVAVYELFLTPGASDGQLAAAVNHKLRQACAAPVA